MCRPITCDKCKRPGYAGCGMHIEQVLGNVPVAERCQCRAAAKAAKAARSGKPWWSLFGK